MKKSCRPRELSNLLHQKQISMLIFMQNLKIGLCIPAVCVV